MSDISSATLDEWATRLHDVDIPVLRSSVEELKKLSRHEDDVVARDISNVVLRDPMLTLRVLRTLQTLHPNRCIADITTIEHGVMMMGVSPFFRLFRDVAVVEKIFSFNPRALARVGDVSGRARHAALHARDWAILRGDIESDEIVIAALLHDMAEMLIWLFAPKLAQEIDNRMLQDRSLRSAAVQKDILGVRLSDLQLRLCKDWQLPDLLRSLMDDHQLHRPRARNALLAVALARHSSHGWRDAALSSDLDDIAGFLDMSNEDVEKNIYWVELAAVLDQQTNAISPLASRLPPLPRFFCTGATAHGAVTHGYQEGVVEYTFEYLSHPMAEGGTATSAHLNDTAREIGVLDTITCAMNGIQSGFGFERVLFFDLDAEQKCFIPKYVVGEHNAEQLSELVLKTSAPIRADQLLRQASESDQFLDDLLRQWLPSQLASRRFAAYLLWNEPKQCLGLIYADGGAVTQVIADSRTLIRELVDTAELRLAGRTRSELEFQTRAA